MTSHYDYDRTHCFHLMTIFHLSILSSLLGWISRIQTILCLRLFSAVYNRLCKHAMALFHCSESNPELWELRPPIFRGQKESIINIYPGSI